MCGIAGIISNKLSGIDKVILDEMLNITKHRGPDDQGVYFDDSVALGQNRLSIIDLSNAGHQPMVSSDSRYVIVYNGEIYNFKEIRIELEKFGYRFFSNTDTEVLLNGYIHFGINILQKIRGMFSFLIWDNVDKVAFGGRDHIGIKPFLYSLTDGKLKFCSEIKGFLTKSCIKPEISDESVSTFLTLGHTIPPFTMLKNVFALKSGHYLIYKNGKLDISKYWFPEKITPESKVDLSYEESVNLVREFTLNSISEELISDVPLGVFQSGGLDSTIITAAMKLLGINQIETFTIGYELSSNNIDETLEAKNIANYYNTSHNSWIVKNNDIETYFIDYIEGLDQPSADGYNTYLISKFASKKVKVSLSGLGSDELFIGYYGFLQMLNRKSSWFNKLLINTIGLTDSVVNLPDLLNYRIEHEKSVYDDLSYYIFLLERNSEKFNKSILKSKFLGYSPHQITKEVLRNNYAFPENKLNAIHLLYMQQFMSNLNLRDSDTVAMSSSLEVRFPLIDVRLMELALKIPLEHKVIDTRSLGERQYGSNGLKRLLFDAFAKELPASLYKEKKKGFQLPTNVWFNTGLREFLEDTVNKPSFLFNKEYVRKVYLDWQKDNRKWKQVWSVFILDQWIKKVYLK